MRYFRPFGAGLLLAMSLLFFGLSTAAEAQNVRIIAPYAGPIINRLEQELSTGSPLELEDTGLMTGLYLQWINDRFFQANSFIYHSPDINYATLWGIHFNADAYLFPGPLGRVVVGVGYEQIWLDLDGGAEIAEDTTDFVLTNDISVPFFRAGYSFRFDAGATRLSLFPWAGVQFERVDGDISFTVDPNGPAPPPAQDIEEPIDENTTSGLIGLNTRLFLLRFLQGEAKYRIALGDGEPRHTVTGMLNLFFSRHLGLSYRARYSESSAGEEIYHLFGVVYTF